jgi:hypothetical protein
LQSLGARNGGVQAEASHRAPAVRRLMEYTTETNKKNKDLMVHDPEGETYREDQSRMLCVRPVSGEVVAACKYVAARSG